VPCKGRALERHAPLAAGVWSFEDLSSTRRVAVELTPREREVAAQLATGIDGLPQRGLFRQVVRSSAAFWSSLRNSSGNGTDLPAA
jgi:hypothetical protein